MPKSRQRWRDELADLLEAAGVDELGDALAGGELAGGVLPLDAGRAAAGFGPSFQIREGVPTGHESGLRLDAYALAAAACAFSWSFRNRSSPLSVSGWLNICSITLPGHVQTSAPMRAASTMCCGPRTLATSTSVV